VESEKAEVISADQDQAIASQCKDSYYGDVTEIDPSPVLKLGVRFGPIQRYGFLGPILIPLIPIQLGKPTKGYKLTIRVSRISDAAASPNEEARIKSSSLFLKTEQGNIIRPDSIMLGGKFLEAKDWPEYLDFEQNEFIQTSFRLKDLGESKKLDLFISNSHIRVRFEKKWHYWPVIFGDMVPGFWSCSLGKKPDQPILTAKDLEGIWEGGEISTPSPSISVPIGNSASHASYVMELPGHPGSDKTWSLALKSDGNFFVVDTGKRLGLSQNQGRWELSKLNELLLHGADLGSETIAWKILELDRVGKMVVEEPGNSRLEMNRRK
jgi:hypothetical protein